MSSLEAAEMFLHLPIQLRSHQGRVNSGTSSQAQRHVSPGKRRGLCPVVQVLRGLVTNRNSPGDSVRVTGGQRLCNVCQGLRRATVLSPIWAIVRWVCPQNSFGFLYTRAEGEMSCSQPAHTNS